MRIAVGCIGHETNTFSSVPTTLDSFKNGTYYLGQEMIPFFQNTRTIMGGLIKHSQALQIELIPLLWTFATPSGTVTKSAYQTLKTEFLDLLRQAGKIDGVFLDLHGAMVTDAIQDVEGDLIAAVGQMVGDRPIMTTLDLHANITAEMARQSSVIIGFDTYPHIDCYERGIEAAGVLHDIIDGEIQPTTAYRQLPLLTSPPAQCTMKPLMQGILEQLHHLETEPKVVTATLSMGFPFADIYDAGVSVVITTNADQELASHYADTFAADIWEMRNAFDLDLVSVEQAIKLAVNSQQKPTILAEGSDNPGGGGPCDGTLILQALIDADVQETVVAVISDPDSVTTAIKAGVGNEVQFEVGGKTDPLHGQPVSLTGYVKTISDGIFIHKGPMGRGRTGFMGRTVVIKVGGIEVILTEKRIQPYDAEVLRSLGIEPTDRKLIVLKSAVHFRADYEPIASQILEVDTPGVHSPDLFSYNYQKLRRPIYPLDPQTTF